MKAKIKSYFSADIIDLENYLPVTIDSFSILLTFLVGLENTEGKESFDFLVCTPKWLLENYRTDEVIFGKGIIIVFEYNFQKILNKIKKLIENTEGATWREIAEKLSRYGDWEFENYTP